MARQKAKKANQAEVARAINALRRMVRETTLTPDNFIYPLFVGPGKGVKREISSLPGQFHFSVDEVVREVMAVIGEKVKS